MDGFSCVIKNPIFFSIPKVLKVPVVYGHNALFRESGKHHCMCNLYRPYIILGSLIVITKAWLLSDTVDNGSFPCNSKSSINKSAPFSSSTESIRLPWHFVTWLRAESSLVNICWQNLHRYCFTLLWTLLECLYIALMSLNFFSQRLHWYGNDPVCFLVCLFKSPLVTKPLEQCSHM